MRTADQTGAPAASERRRHSGRGPGVPKRLIDAVELLDPRHGQHICEIGGGRGIAARLVCDRLESGRFVGLDRSEHAVAAARLLNRDHIGRGLADFRRVALRDVEPAALGRFDIVFAINVNLFWTGRATTELPVISQLLKQRGALWIIYNYSAVDPSARSQLAERIGPRLESSGLSWSLLSQSRTGNAFVIRALPVDP